MFKNTLLPVLLATIWISFSEFLRNEYLFKHLWDAHYDSLGLVFKTEPINGMVWGLWSLLLAIAIYILAKKFNLLETTLITWMMTFVMMWLVVGNMGVLPYKILLYAIPLSLLEVFVAALIIKKLG